VKLIIDVVAIVNDDHVIRNLLKVVFDLDYNVGVAEMLILASDLSQHIRYLTFHIWSSLNSISYWE
jgi:glucan phosphorylase